MIIVELVSCPGSIEKLVTPLVVTQFCWGWVIIESEYFDYNRWSLTPHGLYTLTWRCSLNSRLMKCTPCRQACRSPANVFITLISRQQAFPNHENISIYRRSSAVAISLQWRAENRQTDLQAPQSQMSLTTLPTVACPKTSFNTRRSYSKKLHEGHLGFFLDPQKEIVITFEL